MTNSNLNHRPENDLFSTLDLLGIDLRCTIYGNEPDRLALQLTLLTKDDVAAKIGKSRSAVDRLIHSGQLKSVKFGSSVLIPMSSFVEYFTTKMQVPYADFTVFPY